MAFCGFFFEFRLSWPTTRKWGRWVLASHLWFPRGDIETKLKSWVTSLCVQYKPLKWFSNALSKDSSNKTFSQDVDASLSASSYIWSKVSPGIYVSRVGWRDELDIRSAIYRVGLVLVFLGIVQTELLSWWRMYVSRQKQPHHGPHSSQSEAAFDSNRTNNTIDR